MPAKVIMRALVRASMMLWARAALRFWDRAGQRWRSPHEAASRVSDDLSKGLYNERCVS
jgi:hypothetical protein